MPLTPATAVLGNTTLLLDELYQAYQGIFTQAKDQLQTLELDDQQIGRLAEKILANKEQMNTIYDRIAVKVKEQIAAADEDNVVFKRTVSAMADQVMVSIAEAIDETIGKSWETYLDSEAAQAKMEEKIQLNSKITKALAAAEHLKALQELMQ